MVPSKYLPVKTLKVQCKDLARTTLNPTLVEDRTDPGVFGPRHRFHRWFVGVVRWLPPASACYLLEASQYTLMGKEFNP
jgi:hypothetical protein